MTTLNIATPVKFKMTNTAERAVSFMPYRENFVTTLIPQSVVEFSVDTAGQALYYLLQATQELTVEKIEAFDAADETTTVIELPALITITNTSDKVKSFVPYRENFSYDVKPGDAIELEATTVGQVLYYMSQETEGLTVEQEKVVEA